MTEAPAPQVTNVIHESNDRGKAVIDKLTALQNAHRLAIHMVESSVPMFKVHQKTLDDLNAVDPKDICLHLKKGKASLFSMSLLPSTQSGVAILPYSVRSDRPNSYGYLFDLSQTTADSAKVTRASYKGLNSDSRGISPTRKHKSYKLTREKELPELKKFYAKFIAPDETKWKKNIEAAIGGQKGCCYTESQLDALGNAYIKANNALTHIQIDEDPCLFNYNEILVAAHPKHIAAIAIPFYHRTNSLTPTTQAQHHEKKQFVRLQAAITGLGHLALGYNFPVVLYHVSGEGRGKVEFVGQQKTELMKVALEALAELGKSGHMAIEKRLPNYPSYPEYTSLVDMIRQHLCIDVSPNNRDWPKEVTKSARTSPAPAPPPHQTSPASGGRC